jgi:tetratricopeptide (TPR) repeat protein
MRSVMAYPALLAFLIMVGVPPYTCAQQSPKATAQPGGIAITGDVTGSTLNAYSRDPADVQQIARLLADLSAEKDAHHAAVLRAEKLADEAQIPKQQMLVFLSILAKQEVKPEQVPATMAEIARNYQRQQDNYATLAPQDPSAADLVRRGKQATEAGHFDEADRLLGQAVDRETAAVAEHQIRVAELMAARGDNAATQLHREDAARFYEAAAAKLPADAAEQRAVYLTQAGEMHETYGNSAAALKSYRDGLTIADRLAKSDPGNAGWQRDLALSYGLVAKVEARQGAHADGLRDFRQGRDIVARLARESPDNAILHNDLAWFDDQIATHNK